MNQPTCTCFPAEQVSATDDLGAKALEHGRIRHSFPPGQSASRQTADFRHRETSAAFVLPGNPVRSLRVLASRCQTRAESLSGTGFALESSRPRPPRGKPASIRLRAKRFGPAKVVIRNGSLSVIPKPWSTSGNTFALIDTNSLVRIDGSSTPEKKVSTLIVGKLTTA